MNKGRNKDHILGRGESAGAGWERAWFFGKGSGDNDWSISIGWEGVVVMAFVEPGNNAPEQAVLGRFPGNGATGALGTDATGKAEEASKDERECADK